MTDPRPMPIPDRLAGRQLALRAIMDGRGLDAVILSSLPSLAHYGGLGSGDASCLLVVTAREARLAWPGHPPGIWAEATALLPDNCALGHEDDVPADALAAVQRLRRPRRLISISADIARQIAEG
ncbi:MULTISPECIES: hypothetical protein [unclassified Paracoccus (in: a-proteobacteria)]|uniref:hypothetical protein n=1 Tax=unclassified Paracoccus (in: a-proteobacteria) TaxID=2688777 RepID=UPI0015FEC5B4|nr:MULTISPECIES: hypothetical protein [unclassified Paracoccus (in: a-proteobacteria)]MBB1491099.1 hypothetical protein [Paracoccus sp. MC1854]MBB1497086.1 hypothetical protein [Paracoccus sp. MC1862]QQO44515.1 hypothetical protein JGR78_14340 [Paracoccus sp. MC1862]